MAWTALFDSVTLMEAGRAKVIEQLSLKHTHGLGEA